jgi:hypothetical protein
MADEAEFCSSVWIEMPCIVVAAPITAMHTTPMAKLWVPTKPAVASVSARPANTAMRVRPPRRPRIATRVPPTRAENPIVLASVARPRASRPNRSATYGGSISGTARSIMPTAAANSMSGPMPRWRAT